MFGGGGGGAGLFGAPQQPTGSLFGGAGGQTGGLFGGQTANPTMATSSIFGSTAPAGGGGGLFGGTATTSALFGSTAGMGGVPQTAGLFGAGAQPSAGGLFGGGAPQANTGGLFSTQPGVSTPFGTTPSLGVGMSFGATTQSAFGQKPMFGTSAPTSTGGLFGAPNPGATGNMFGAAQPAATQSYSSVADQHQQIGEVPGTQMEEFRSEKTKDNFHIQAYNMASKYQPFSLKLLRMKDYNDFKQGKVHPKIMNDLQAYVAVGKGQMAGNEPKASGMGYGTTTAPVTTMFMGTQPSSGMGGGMFGAIGTQGGTQSGGGLFGGGGGFSQPASGGLFGQTQPASTGGGIFGQGQGQPGGGLFGANPTPQSGGGGLFGNPSPAGGMFGQNPSGAGGMMGQTNQMGGQGGLFGGNPNSGMGAPQGGGLFGASSPQPTGGLFGATNPQQGGLFGGSNPAQQGGGGLFGGQTGGQTGGGLFGGSAGAGAQGGLFGQVNVGAGGQMMPQGAGAVPMMMAGAPFTLPDAKTPYAIYFVPGNPSAKEKDEDGLPEMFKKEATSNRKESRNLQDVAETAEINALKRDYLNQIEGYNRANQFSNTGLGSNPLYQMEQGPRIYNDSRSTPQGKLPATRATLPSKSNIIGRNASLYDVSSTRNSTGTGSRLNEDSVNLSRMTANDGDKVLIEVEIEHGIAICITVNPRDVVSEIVRMIIDELGVPQDSKKAEEYANNYDLWYQDKKLSNISRLYESKFTATKGAAKFTFRKRASTMFGLNKPQNSNYELAPTQAIPILTKEGYSTTPEYSKICRMTLEELRAVPNFEVHHKFATVAFLGPTDLRGLNLDQALNIQHRMVEIYPEDSNKPAKGEGLNKPATITLKQFGLKPQDNNDKYISSLKAKLAKMNSIMIGIDVAQDTLTFQVEGTD